MDCLLYKLSEEVAKTTVDIFGAISASRPVLELKSILFEQIVRHHGINQLHKEKPVNIDKDNLQHEIENFCHKTGTISTVFEKNDKGEYIRIATVLRDEKGNFAIGTVLLNDTVINAIKKEGHFFGNVTLFGSEYTALYRKVGKKYVLFNSIQI